MKEVNDMVKMLNTAYSARMRTLKTQGESIYDDKNSEPEHFSSETHFELENISDINLDKKMSDIMQHNIGKIQKNI